MGPKGGRPNRHDAFKIEQRRTDVARRYLHGQTHAEIAAVYGVHETVITKDVRWLHREWVRTRQHGMDEIKARELALIDEVQRQAWLGWAKSMQDAQAQTTRAKGDRTETETTSKGQSGNPRFLEIVLKCGVQRCQLLGVIEKAPVDGVPQSVAQDITFIQFKALPVHEQIRVMHAKFESWVATAEAAAIVPALPAPPEATGDA